MHVHVIDIPPLRILSLQNIVKFAGPSLLRHLAGMHLLVCFLLAVAVATEMHLYLLYWRLVRPLPVALQRPVCVPGMSRV